MEGSADTDGRLAVVMVVRKMPTVTSGSEKEGERDDEEDEDKDEDKDYEEEDDECEWMAYP